MKPLHWLQSVRNQSAPDTGGGADTRYSRGRYAQSAILEEEGMNALKVAIVGASGYSGEELVRLLYRHPNVNIACITSRQYAGQPVGNVFPRFAELDLTFSAPDTDRIARMADAAFLALPHGLAAEYAKPLVDKGVTVIDISADFRLRDPALYEKYYDTRHPAPELLAKAVYGMPERYRDPLGDASLVACPGCYPTSVILATAPLLEQGLVESSGICSTSLSGVTGAGRKAKLPLLFAECNESVRPYGVTGHRHTPEIEQELAVAAGKPKLQVGFIPHLVPVSRGIHSTITARAAHSRVTGGTLHQALADAYEHEPFVRVLAPGSLADTKHVTMTNMCEIGVAFDERTGRVIVSSAIDNLTKGAAGQAVQCMNVAAGFEETVGLW